MQNALKSNTKIAMVRMFREVYRAMFEEGEYRKYDWVVKIDPDTVINDVVRDTRPRTQC